MCAGERDSLSRKQSIRGSERDNAHIIRCVLGTVPYTAKGAQMVEVNMVGWVVAAWLSIEKGRGEGKRGSTREQVGARQHEQRGSEELT